MGAIQISDRLTYKYMYYINIRVIYLKYKNKKCTKSPPVSIKNHKSSLFNARGIPFAIQCLNAAVTFACVTLGT